MNYLNISLLGFVPARAGIKTRVAVGIKIILRAEAISKAGPKIEE